MYDYECSYLCRGTSDWTCDDHCVSAFTRCSIIETDDVQICVSRRDQCLGCCPADVTSTPTTGQPTSGPTSGECVSLVERPFSSIVSYNANILSRAIIIHYLCYHWKTEPTSEPINLPSAPPSLPPTPEPTLPSPVSVPTLQPNLFPVSTQVGVPIFPDDSNPKSVDLPMSTNRRLYKLVKYVNYQCVDYTSAPVPMPSLSPTMKPTPLPSNKPTTEEVWKSGWYVMFNSLFTLLLSLLIT